MRTTTALAWFGALVAGLVVFGGPAGVPSARAADAARPWLGVYMQGLTPELREGLDLGGTGGVLVSGVVRDGPADRAGIRKGDVIVRIGSRAVESPDELSEVVGSARPGQSLAVQAVREGQHRTFDVKLGSRPSDEEMESPETRVAPEPPQGKEWGSPDEPEAPEAPRAPDYGRARDLMRGFDLPDPNMVRIFTSMDRGRLGVRIESLNPGLGDYFGLKDGKGALVVDVVKDTPASRAGLHSTATWS